MKRTVYLLCHFLMFGSIAFFTSGCFIIRNNFYTDPAKCYHEALLEKPYDAIIIPGFPHDTAKGWDRIVQGRIYWAVFLYERGIAKNLIEKIEDLVEENEREGITLTCKQELVSFYEKFGFVNHGLSESKHGGVRWYNLVKLRKDRN